MNKLTPVAFGLFWKNDGKEILQWPVADSVSDAEQELKMYSPEDRKNMTIDGLVRLSEVGETAAKIERLKQTPTIEEAKTTVEHLRAYASANGYSHGDYADVMTEAANQIEKQSERIKELEADADEEAHIRDRMAQLLAETAVSIKGPEKALHRHGWQDLPEVAEKQSAALKLARYATEAVIRYQTLLESGKPHGLINSYGTAYESCVEALAAIDALQSN